MPKEPELLISQRTIDDRLYLRPMDVQHAYGIHNSTVRLAINKGELPARKFKGRGWLIARKDLDEWFERVTESNIAA